MTKTIHTVHVDTETFNRFMIAKPTNEVSAVFIGNTIMRYRESNKLSDEALYQHLEQGRTDTQPMKVVVDSDISDDELAIYANLWAGSSELVPIMQSRNGVVRWFSKTELGRRFKPDVSKRELVVDYLKRKYNDKRLALTSLAGFGMTFGELIVVSNIFEALHKFKIDAVTTTMHSASAIGDYLVDIGLADALLVALLFNLIVLYVLPASSLRKFAKLNMSMVALPVLGILLLNTATATTTVTIAFARVMAQIVTTMGGLTGSLLAVTVIMAFGIAVTNLINLVARLVNGKSYADITSLPRDTEAMLRVTLDDGRHTYRNVKFKSDGTNYVYDSHTEFYSDVAVISDKSN